VASVFWRAVVRSCVGGWARARARQSVSHPRPPACPSLIGHPNADILHHGPPPAYAHGREAVGGAAAWPQVHPPRPARPARPPARPAGPAGVVRARGTHARRQACGARRAGGYISGVRRSLYCPPSRFRRARPAGSRRWVSHHPSHPLTSTRSSTRSTHGSVTRVRQAHQGQARHLLPARTPGGLACALGLQAPADR
jgi:hypothetical protein